MVDRANYELLELVNVDEIEIEIAEPPSPPDESVFVILGETTEGEKVALSIPFAELDNILKAVTYITKKYPQGQRAQ